MKFCENSTFFGIWIFYSTKNKMKVGFGYEKSSFSRDKYGNCGPKFFLGGDKNSWNSAKTALFPFWGYMSYTPPFKKSGVIYHQKSPPPLKPRVLRGGLTLWAIGFNFCREEMILGLWLIWHFSSSQADRLADLPIMWLQTTHKNFIFNRFLR